MNLEIIISSFPVIIGLSCVTCSHTIYSSLYSLTEQIQRHSLLNIMSTHWQNVFSFIWVDVNVMQTIIFQDVHGNVILTVIRDSSEFWDLRIPMFLSALTIWIISKLCLQFCTLLQFWLNLRQVVKDGYYRSTWMNVESNHPSAELMNMLHYDSRMDGSVWYGRCNHTLSLHFLLLYSHGLGVCFACKSLLKRRFNFFPLF